MVKRIRSYGLMHINLFEIRQNRRIDLNKAVLWAGLALVVIAALVAYMPKEFFADCKNITGGDVCHITLGGQP